MTEEGRPGETPVDAQPAAVAAAVEAGLEQMGAVLLHATEQFAAHSKRTTAATLKIAEIEAGRDVRLAELQAQQGAREVELEHARSAMEHARAMAAADLDHRRKVIQAALDHHLERARIPLELARVQLDQSSQRHSAEIELARVDLLRAHRTMHFEAEKAEIGSERARWEMRECTLRSSVLALALGLAILLAGSAWAGALDFAVPIIKDLSLFMAIIILLSKDAVSQLRPRSERTPAWPDHPANVIDGR